jgi:hypothetical protein
MAKNDIFTKVQVQKVKSNTFDLSHDVKLSLNMGELVPITVMECIPGDRFNINTEILLRFAPMVAPVMHKINVFTHYFFVPNRLVWPNWEKFITGNNGSESAPPSPPTIKDIQVSVGDLADYLGLPITEDNTGTIIPGGVIADPVSAIPFAAYQKIYDDFYRDQNLQPSTWQPLTDGNNTIGLSNLLTKRTRAWEHDYFTSSLPFAQKGEAVTIPLLGEADIVVDQHQEEGVWQQGRWKAANPATTMPITQTAINQGVGVGNSAPSSSGSSIPNLYDPNGTLKADLSSASSATINDLRRAFRLQEWLEKMARGGSRYIEQIAMHFGVKSSDARLQRPQFLGGHKQPVIISEVLQTSESGESSPQGTMAGHALSASSGKNINYTCEEHGYIIGIMSTMPKTAYQQGIPKHFSRKSYLDYAWPTFAHIGEQEVKNKEIFYGNDTKDDETFGYIPRYSEYRYLDSRVAGEFRTSLAFWHLGRIFGNRPLLNANFIECKPDTRIFAVETEGYDQHIWGHVYNNIRVNRKLPKYGTPQF